MNHFIEQQSRRLNIAKENLLIRIRMIPVTHTVFQTLQAFSEDRCSLLAASLSYYALLSIFPLMLFLLAVANAFIPSERVERMVAGFIGSNIPLGAGVLFENLQQVTQARGSVTLVAAIGFIWSASGVFDMIQLGLNRAFRVQRPRPMWRQRLVSLGMVVSTSLLFGLSFLLTTSLRVAIHYRLIPRHNLLIDTVPPLGAFILSVLVFGLLYRYVPFEPNIGWRNALIGALLAATLWEIAKLVFAWYIMDYALLNLVYGSVGAIIAIMLWGYITAMILLLGAELTAVLTGARQREKRGDEWWALVSP